LLLDAAMGSDLDRRGVKTSLPLWSALGLLEAPDVVYRIHRDNLEAGADILTTNTFRTTQWSLRKAGIDTARAAELDMLAVELAMTARSDLAREDAMIAGSIAPLEDCYLPTFEIDPGVALHEHRAQARNLAAAGVDFLLIETMPTIAEAMLALAAASETGLQTAVSFVCAAAAAEETEPRLLSGETLVEAMSRVAELAPAAILVNCAPASAIAAGIRALRAASAVPFGGYANVGHVDDDVGWSSAGGMTGAEYAAAAEAWLDAGARVIGGCCGTNPEHTAALRTMIDQRFS
jgi:S-methylmethionine-dependent homocysteine/selenocysteine methylase